MIGKLPSHEGVGRPDVLAKINELVDAVNQLGQVLSQASIVWGDVPKPDGWKWE